MKYSIKEENELFKKELRKDFLDTIWVHRPLTEEEKKEAEELSNSQELKDYRSYRLEKLEKLETIQYNREIERQISIQNDNIERYW